MIHPSSAWIHWVPTQQQNNMAKQNLLKDATNLKWIEAKEHKREVSFKQRTLFANLLRGQWQGEGDVANGSRVVSKCAVSTVVHESVNYKHGEIA